MKREYAFILAGYLEDALSPSALKMEEIAADLGATTLHTIAGITEDKLSFNGNEITGRAWFPVKPEDLVAGNQAKAPDLRNYEAEIVSAADYVLKQIGNKEKPVVIGFSQGAMIAEAVYYRSGGTIPCISIQGASVDFMSVPDADYPEKMYIFQRPDTPQSYPEAAPYQIHTTLPPGPHAVTPDDTVLISAAVQAQAPLNKSIISWRDGKAQKPQPGNDGIRP